MNVDREQLKFNIKFILFFVMIAIANAIVEGW